jgi:hypothetical protein
MERSEMKSTTHPRRGLKYTTPVVHDNGPISLVTAGDDTVGEPERDSWFCANDVVPREPRD